MIDEALAVAVYDVEKKECVMIFSSINKVDRYVFDKMNYGSSRTRYLASNKGKTKKNAFDKLLAFRYANKTQKDQLGENEMLILNKEFIRYNVKINSQMKPTKMQSKQLTSTK